jgi:uncharacterized protein (DUF2147 family)
LNKIRRVKRTNICVQVERDSMTDDELYIWMWTKEKEKKKKIHDLTYYSMKGKKRNKYECKYIDISNGKQYLLKWKKKGRPNEGSLWWNAWLMT